MSVFLAAQLGELSEPPALRDAVQLAQTEVPMASDPEDPMQHKQAQAWELRQDPSMVVDKNGALNNTSSYIGIVPDKQVGTVILTNRGDQYVAKVGRRILLRLTLTKEIALQKLQQLEQLETLEEN